MAKFNILGQVEANLIEFQAPSIFVMPTERKLFAYFLRQGGDTIFVQLPDFVFTGISKYNVIFIYV